MIKNYDIDQYKIKAFIVNLYKCKDVWTQDSRYSEGITRVWYGDPKNARKAIYEFAVYFRREFGYDFVQYSMEMDRSSHNGNTQAFLFHHYEFGTHCRRIAYGACCFRFRKDYTDVEPHWALQWIWIHPLNRGNGTLTKHWKTFECLFGNFMVETPLSKAMKYFLDKQIGTYSHRYEDILKKESVLSE